MDPDHLASEDLVIISGYIIWKSYLCVLVRLNTVILFSSLSHVPAFNLCSAEKTSRPFQTSLPTLVLLHELTLSHTVFC